MIGAGSLHDAFRSRCLQQHLAPEHRQQLLHSLTFLMWRRSIVSTISKPRSDVSLWPHATPEMLL